MSENANLLPCPNPWCDDSDLCVESSRRHWSAHPPKFVECQCGTHGPDAETEELAIAAWNTRAPAQVTHISGGDVTALKAAWSVMMREFGHVFGNLDDGYYPEVDDMRKAVASFEGPSA